MALFTYGYMWLYTNGYTIFWITIQYNGLHSISSWIYWIIILDYIVNKSYLFVYLVQVDGPNDSSDDESKDLEKILEDFNSDVVANDKEIGSIPPLDIPTTNTTNHEGKYLHFNFGFNSIISQK